MNTRFNLTVGFLFILVGALLGSNYIIQYIQNSIADAVPYVGTSVISKVATTTTSSSTPVRTALPTHLDVTQVGLSIAVAPGYYDTKSQTWTLGDSDAYFATPTSVPNTVAGNTYIYGHNRSSVFHALYNAKLGDTAVVTTADNMKFTYKLVDIHDVRPTDDSLLEYTGKPILTLQTCSGFLDSTRRLFIFDLVSAS